FTVNQKNKNSSLNLNKINSWIFDLDNTLYHPSLNIFEEIDSRMQKFISLRLGIGLKEAWTLQKKYFRKYGATLKGLMKFHQIDPKQFLDYVQKINLEKIKVNPELKSALAELNGTKIVYTNSTKNYANRILKRLGLKKSFDGIFDIMDANYIPKPSYKSYKMLLKNFNLIPEESIMFEDLPQNLVPASKLGMRTVWVKNEETQNLRNNYALSVNFTTKNLTEWIQKLTRKL
ncbi:MAG: pyrimidine 5'-nucleotidase, partial [Pseudomonadota bacterium]|nr:pyrimidine 5'-nucleotidase [Pseudomonadota bacterium]